MSKNEKPKKLSPKKKIVTEKKIMVMDVSTKKINCYDIFFSNFF